MDNVLNKMDDLNSKNKSELRKQKIKKELEKLKAFKSKCKTKLTIGRLKAMKGFEHISDELAKQIISQLEEYTKIVLTQMNRLSIIKSKTSGIKNQQI